MSEYDAIEAIDKKLVLITRLLALMVADGKSKTEAINTLAKAGLDRTLVAEIVGTTPLTVSVTRSRKKSAQKCVAQ